MAPRKLEIRGNLESAYADVFTPEAVAALEALAGLDADRKAVMAARIERRAGRARNKQGISFLYADVFTPEAVAALEALAGLDADRKAVMAARIERRAGRARNKQRISFLD